MMHRKFTLTVVIAAACIVGSARTASAQGNSTDQDTPDKKEVREYALTADKLTRYENAVKAIVKLTNDNPTLKKQMDAEAAKTPMPTITTSTTVIANHSEVVSILKQFGFTPREYVVMTFSLISSAGYVSMKKSGISIPMPLTTSAANVAFTQQYYDRITAVLSTEAGPSDSNN